MIGVLCNWCGKLKPRHEVMEHPGGYKRCLRCEDAHMEALKLLATGDPPKFCLLCERTHEQLERELGERYTYMIVHGPVDGIYIAACPECSETLRQKQLTHYKGTEFGAKKLGV